MALLAPADDETVFSANVVDLQLERELREAAGRAADELSACRCGTTSFASVLKALVAPFNSAPECRAAQGQAG